MSRQRVRVTKDAIPAGGGDKSPGRENGVACFGTEARGSAPHSHTQSWRPGETPKAFLGRFMSSGCERGWVLDRDGLWGRGGLGSGADDADFCRNACASCGVRKLSDDAFA